MAESVAPWASFWTWWSHAGPRIAHSIEDRSVGQLVDEISNAVHAIHPGLAWELGPGQVAKHAFTLSPEGNIEYRRLTERWLRSAPAADATWQYFPSRQPARGLTLELGGAKFSSDDWRFGIGVDDQRLLLHVKAHHPSLARCAQQDKVRAVFVAIDQLFGEDQVERWIGQVEPSEATPANALAAADVDQLMGKLATESKEERFTLARGEDEHGRPLFLNWNARLKRLDHLFAETRIQIDLTLQQPTDSGLTIDREAGRLDQSRGWSGCCRAVGGLRRADDRTGVANHALLCRECPSRMGRRVAVPAAARRSLEAVHEVGRGSAVGLLSRRTVPSVQAAVI